MRLVVTGGGTGGHLFPGLAVAEAMKQRVPEAKILFIGTERAMDQKVLSQAKLETAVLKCSGLKGATIADKVKSLAKQPLAILHARKLLKDFQADLVLGVGGYVTGPVLAAAKILGIPGCIHEQNSVPGLANRLAGKIVDKIFTSIPCATGFPDAKVIQTGNPVRKEIIQGAEEKEQSSQVSLLVLGGSQGAHRVNTLMTEAAAILDQTFPDISIVHQTGPGDEESVRASYEQLSLDSQVSPFIADMAQAYQRADLVISRAGATTLAELAVMGLPAILIPYPFAADDHQQKNAEYYSRNGGGIVFPEKELKAARLAEVITVFLQAPEKLGPMANNMRSMALPRAADTIVDHCLELVGGVLL